MLQTTTSEYSTIVRRMAAEQPKQLLLDAIESDRGSIDVICTFNRYGIAMPYLRTFVGNANGQVHVYLIVPPVESGMHAGVAEFYSTHMTALVGLQRKLSFTFANRQVTGEN